MNTKSFTYKDFLRIQDQLRTPSVIGASESFIRHFAAKKSDEFKAIYPNAIITCKNCGSEFVTFIREAGRVIVLDTEHNPKEGFCSKVCKYESESLISLP